MNHYIEIRTITLKPGTRAEFQQLYIEQALPLLKRWNFDVVAHGPSLHDEHMYYVIRHFDNLGFSSDIDEPAWDHDRMPCATTAQ